MSKIVSIATALPQYKHEQKDIFGFMQRAYCHNGVDSRKLKFLYDQCGIETRYSVIPDYSSPASDWKFYKDTENLEPFPSLEQRMAAYNESAPALAIKAIEECIKGKIRKEDITHLITVSCTGMTAPGLELQIIEEMGLPTNVTKTSINFMGCYAAIHALKLADAICNNDPKANVIIVCAELCTLHFQKSNSLDNIMSSLIFADGVAAALVTNNNFDLFGLHIKDFYSEVSLKGKKDMRWELSSSGFLMTLSQDIPELLQESFNGVVESAFRKASVKKDDISHWCIHPGGKKILNAVEKAIDILPENLSYSYNVLREHGNMSSATILFVMKEIFDSIKSSKQKANIFGAAFGPGLTTETFILTT